MRDGARIAVIIPALNEESSIGKVLDEIPAWADEVIVADNGSADGTREAAADHGATVVREDRRGYGSACLRGIAALPRCDVVVFLDGDYSDYPAQMDRLVDPIVAGEADLVIGSRALGDREPGALSPQQRFGNALACLLLRLFWGVRYTDLGPFRAVRYSTLMELGMADPNYGWTVEMQIKAALRKARGIEVPVDYRKRIGRSKVSGTLRGVVGAGYKILSTIFISAAKHYLGLSPRWKRRRLIVFTRYPEPGKTKTRLIPALGEEGAADLQREMTEHALRTAEALPGLEVEIRYAGGGIERMADWLGAQRLYRDQGEGDLGARMQLAFKEAFADGIEETLIIGTDCPDISAGVLRDAFERFRASKLVLGPATDGGYYLIGLTAESAKRALPKIFEDIEWGTETVYERTRAHANRLGLGLARLVPLADIDRPEDLAVWDGHRNPEERPRISVVIPALNEEDTLADTLRPLLETEGVEVIVADGGSSDSTAEIAASAGATVLTGRRGRAAQMNLGAARASGGYLLFLHADTRVPEDFDSEIARILGDTSVIAGAFRFATDDPRLRMRLIAMGTNLRARWLGMPYGDQGLFMTRESFRELGGYDELPLMEDFRFVRRARKRGRILIASQPAITSARRWLRLGPWRTVLYNQATIVGYCMGVPPERLARFYHGHKDGE